MHWPTVALLLAVPRGLAAPSIFRDDEYVVEHEFVTSSDEEALIREYWTPERIEAIDHDPYRDGPSPSIPEEERPYGAEYTGGGAIPSTVGRLLFTAPYTNGTTVDSSCTATIVESAGEATVLVTAAHCLKPNPWITNITDWHSNILFIPGFRNDSLQANFTIERAFLSNGWVYGPGEGTDRFAVDRTFAVLNADPYSRKSAKAVAGPGQKVKFGKDETSYAEIYNFGYPSAVLDSEDELRYGTSAFTGRRLASCDGQAIDWWQVDTALAGFPCVMGGGSSGGPHLADFEPEEGLGVVVSVNSLLDVQTGQDGTETWYEFGASVTDDFSMQLYEAAQAT